ncbi:706_t:CDS:2, partial [Scutellospora calospora]
MSTLLEGAMIRSVIVKLFVQSTVPEQEKINAVEVKIVENEVMAEI